MKHWQSGRSGKTALLGNNFSTIGQEWAFADGIWGMAYMVDVQIKRPQHIKKIEAFMWWPNAFL
jgi:hypothetical protein